MSILNFLKEQQQEYTKVTKSRGSKYEVPEKGIRVYKTGRVLVSEDAINRFDLEFKSKDSENKGNGIYTYAFNSEKYLVVAPREYPYLDMFNSTKYNDDNTPKNTVNSISGYPYKHLVDFFFSEAEINSEIKYKDFHMEVDELSMDEIRYDNSLMDVIIVKQKKDKEKVIKLNKHDIYLIELIEIIEDEEVEQAHDEYYQPQSEPVTFNIM